MQMSAEMGSSLH